MSDHYHGEDETNSVAALLQQLKHYEEENAYLAGQVIKYRDRCDKVRQLLKKMDMHFYGIRDALVGLEASSD
ncbi:MAG: hypothetical protein H5U32_02455 [Pseudomonas balearica]|jgi:hypothetical protein|uniref:hypothetical protein n=1 Tax=Stutzerimonas balearica TaxID=74829 RepID=UPI0019CDF6F1|nr:hypothetical protein [Stutzerimonas balearica]MBC7198089.1 hypothetical protein [Stutzerimonas balearica]